jgi:transcriptional regulator with XRE-family HTH domain
MPRRPRDPGTPQSPAEYFGAELRAYRETASLSRPQLAEKLGCTGQWVGQIELTTSVPSEAFADDLDTFFATNGTFHRLWEWIKEAGKLQILPPGFPEFLEREAKASIMYIFEAMAITGLFQAPAYAYEVLKSGRTPDEIEQLVARRMERQAVLERNDAPRLVVILDEGVIRRPVGDATVMREQIRHLIELAQRPKITLQIVPNRKGAYPGLMGAFTILGFDQEADLVYVEGHVGGQLIDRAATVREYSLRFDLIRGAAISADDSLTLLHAVLESYEHA